MSNYSNSRKLCKDLCNIFNLPTRHVYNFCRLVSKALVHRVAEDALSSENGKLKTFTIDVPCICTLDIELVDNEIKLNKIQFVETFQEELLKAINEGESPLIIDAEKALVKAFNNRYNSLI